MISTFIMSIGRTGCRAGAAPHCRRHPFNTERIFSARLWRERNWGATEFGHLMHVAAKPLDDRQIEALAVFFAAGGGAPRTAEASGAAD